MTEEAKERSSELIARAGEQMAESLETMFSEVTASQVFNTLERTDDRVVIGATTIERAGGFGFGAGEGVDSAGAHNVGGGGGGGGGGGVGWARPVAVIEVTGRGVQIWPVLDYTRLGLVALGVMAALWKARR